MQGEDMLYNSSQTNSIIEFLPVSPTFFFLHRMPINIPKDFPSQKIHSHPHKHSHFFEAFFLTHWPLLNRRWKLAKMLAW